MVRFGCGMQFINSLGGCVDRSVESKRDFCSTDVVINRLGNADDRRSF